MQLRGAGDGEAVAPEHLWSLETPGLSYGRRERDVGLHQDSCKYAYNLNDLIECITGYALSPHLTSVSNIFKAAFYHPAVGQFGCFCQVN